MNQARYRFLTIPEAGAALLDELDLGVEGSIKGDGTVALPPEVAGRVVSMHLPYSSAGERWNVGSDDEAMRRAALDRVKAAIDTAKGLGATRGVIHPMGIGWWAGRVEATWERTVDGLRELVDHARAAGFLLCLENNRLYWDGIPTADAPEEANRSQANHIIGSTPEEWRGLWHAVGRD